MQGFGGLGLIDIEKAFTRIDEASGGVVFRSQFDVTVCHAFIDIPCPLPLLGKLEAVRRLRYGTGTPERW